MHSLITYWHLDGLTAVFLIGLCLGYFYVIHFHVTERSRYFFAGYGLIILAVASPLHFLADHYLMSAHMVSHVLILLIAAPLLVMGIPEDLSNRQFAKLSDILVKHPWIPWMSGVCIMWLWHIPAIFNNLFGGSYSPALNIIQLASLISAGILFSWPVVGPDSSRRLPALQAVLYLSAACIFCSILGLMITFAPSGVYTRYMDITDHFGFLNVIRNQHGISVLVDQQIAGLIMWVPGCLIYLSASMYLLMKWFRQKNNQTHFVNQQSVNDGKSV
jgi:putative membrane protein